MFPHKRLFVVIVEFDFGSWCICDYGVRLDCGCGCDCDCVDGFARVILWCGENVEFYRTELLLILFDYDARSAILLHQL